MINGISVKVCGLKNRTDAEKASTCGADYLGFILHRDSPRYISVEDYQAMLPDLPAKKKVGVIVYSSMDELAQYKDAGFDYLQLHFPNETPFFEAALWTDIIPPSMFWLAPRVPPGKELDLAFLPLADFFLLDTYHPLKAGGSGQVGDWYQFYRLQGLYQRIRWILAGGLNPENVGMALKESNARLVDVNSGIESAPGVKDADKMKAFFDAIAQVPVAVNS